MGDDPKDETYSDEEARKRAAAALKVMLATPHKPHTKLGGKAEASPPRRSQVQKRDQ